MLKVGQRFAVERKRRESRGFVCPGLLLQRLKMRGNGRENLVGRLSAVCLRGRERAEQRTILALTVSHVTRHTSHVTRHRHHPRAYSLQLARVLKQFEDRHTLRGKHSEHTHASAAAATTP